MLHRPVCGRRAVRRRTFGSDRFDGLATLDYRSGKQTRAAQGTFFGTVHLFTTLSAPPPGKKFAGIPVNPSFYKWLHFVKWIWFNVPPLGRGP